MNTNLQMKPMNSQIKSIHGLEIHGINETGEVHWNLDTESLVQAALERKEGTLTSTGALSCDTGEFTGRSPSDKFVVRDESTENNVDWGKVNQPLSPAHFQKIRQDQLQYLRGKELFVRDAYVGGDREHSVTVRVINETAWQNLFCKHLFLRPSAEELKNIKPQYTIIHTPGFKADPEVHGTKSSTFIVVNFKEGLILIGGTQYAGEMKKSIFSILNYLYPLQGIMAMHCSSNVDKETQQNSALFFGLSGTGKTTLSADPNRRLIGDDEHGWSNEGIFNFEGGCYAKCINLSQEKEPEIWAAIRNGAILENVTVNAQTGTPDYNDGSKTENTRAAYPIDYIEDSVLEATGVHPKNIIFLTCDAFGVMPPISKLSTEQAMYHFLSGYTAKVAGTERGMGNSPQATFSTCFGSPFLPLRPTVYAELLGQKILKHKANCWLVNTGWVGGGFGAGERIKLKFTRAMINAALSGELDNCKFVQDEVFGLSVPESVPNVPGEVLQQKSLWKDRDAYTAAAKDLAQRFKDNFKRFESYRADLADAGPK